VFQKFYIIPMNYFLKMDSLKLYIKRYLDSGNLIFNNEEIVGNQKTKPDVNNYINMIKQLNLLELITTGFMFDMIIRCLPKIVELH
jgi:hypothetical protein